MNDCSETPRLNAVVQSKLLVKVMAFSIAALVLLSAAGQVAKHYFGYPTVFGLVDYFDLNMESNPATWYQTIALLLVGALAAAVAVQEKARLGGYWRHWAGIAFLFVFLSADEGAMIHEATIRPLQRLIAIESGMWSPTWVIPALVGVAIVTVLYVPFFFAHLTLREKLLTLAAGSLFVGGAVGMEMATAGIAFREGYDPAHRDRLVHVIMAHIEETMEMVAVIMFVHVPLRRLEGHALTVVLRGEPAGKGVAARSAPGS